MKVKTVKTEKTAKQIKVAIADDHALFRRGLTELINDFKDVAVVLDAGNGTELIEKMRGTPELPDVCILDINMPVMNGYDTAQKIKKMWPRMKILALSMHDSELSVIKMLKAGANGYVLKDIEPVELEKAVIGVYSNDFYHSDLISGMMMKASAEDGETIHKPNYTLSENEETFLVLCCSELTYKDIADKMSVSPRTIDNYRDNLFLKLNIKSRSGLVIYALKSGLVNIS